jgi:hypothetical protein
MLHQDLRLGDEGREMIFKGPLKRRRGSRGDSNELLVVLLDNALVMAKKNGKGDQYKVYCRVSYVPPQLTQAGS